MAMLLLRPPGSPVAYMCVRMCGRWEARKWVRRHRAMPCRSHGGLWFWRWRCEGGKIGVTDSSIPIPSSGMSTINCMCTAGAGGWASSLDPDVNWRRALGRWPLQASHLCLPHQRPSLDWPNRSMTCPHRSIRAAISLQMGCWVGAVVSFDRPTERFGSRRLWYTYEEEKRPPTPRHRGPTSCAR